MEDNTIEIFENESSPEVDVTREEVIYTSIDEEVIEQMQEDIAQNKADILLRSLITETGNKINLEINSSTYVLTAKLYDKNNNLISTSTGIDLPLETMVVDADYDSTTKEIVLTLKSGSTTRFSIADLVNGLVSDTDYATANKGGVIRVNNTLGTSITTGGILQGVAKTLEQYDSVSNNLIISKGTLENILGAYYKKQVVLTQAEYDAITTPDENTLYIIKEA